MPKANKQVVIDSIIKQIEQGKPTDKICAVICRKFQFSERTFYNHLKIATNQHTAKQEALKKELAQVDRQAAVNARKKAIMTAQERKEYLTKIVLGQVKVPYSEVKWNAKKKVFETVDFEELPNHKARIDAIAELNKMEGDYAPTKIANTDSEGKDLPTYKITLPAGINIQLPSNVEGEE